MSQLAHLSSETRDSMSRPMLQHYNQQRSSDKRIGDSARTSVAASCPEVKTLVSKQQTGSASPLVVTLHHPLGKNVQDRWYSDDSSCHQESGRQQRSSLYRQVRWLPQNPASMLLNYAEFNMSNNVGYDVNNSSQGLDMQNLSSMAEQLEKQKTWMTVNFRYRMNWYEAKPCLERMSRDAAYKLSNLPLWTHCVKVQLHRKSTFLHAVRAFRNRMQCATTGVRFCLFAFYRREKREQKEGPKPKPLPYFRCPDDMPEIKTMVMAPLNVFVSSSASYFDKFWDDSLNGE